MKPPSIVFLMTLICVFSARSQDENSATSARTFVPNALQVPAFTPPIPAEPKVLPTIRIDAATRLPAQSGKTLTLQRGAASTLPDIPPPPPPEPEKPARELTPEDRARIAWQRRHTLNLGATIYDHKISQVNWTDQESGTRFEAICGFDIGLLAGIGSFIHDGENYSVSLMHSDFDTTAIRRSFQGYLPNLPEIAPGQILIIHGDSGNPDATASLKIIRDLIASEKDRLLTYQAARVQHQREAAAWAKAHPPVPRDETFVLRPHRGSRYLANPQPEKTEGTR